MAEEGTGPRCALVGTGYVADMGWYTGATDNSTLMDNGNGYGHYYYSSTSTIDFHWLWANGTRSSGYNVAATFKQARTVPRYSDFFSSRRNLHQFAIGDYLNGNYCVQFLPLLEHNREPDTG